MMLRLFVSSRNKILASVLRSQKCTFLTNTYGCPDSWASRFDSPLLKKVNLEEFYNSLDQNFGSKGVISAIDVDIYANSIKSSTYLDELRDLLHKLRLSADTGNTLESTHHATIRNYIDYGNIEDLVNILKDPLNYGVFLDDFTANILLDKLLTSGDFEKAATVATQVMLQEDYSNEITCSLCQYACYKYILMYVPNESEPVPAPKKIEEVKIRIKFLRNPYFDDHFHITDLYKLSGKTLAWLSADKGDNLNVNLEILGWLIYNKYEHLVTSCEQLAKMPNLKIYKETISLLERESNKEQNEENKQKILECLTILKSMNVATDSLEDLIKINIENSINKRQNKDVSTLEQVCF